MDIKWISVVVALITGGIGVLMKVTAETPRVKKVWAIIGTGLILTGVMILAVLLLGNFGVEVRSPLVWGSQAGAYARATACDMRIGRKEFDKLVGVLRQIRASRGGRPADQFLEIVVEPGKENSCLYAKDLQEVFREIGWWPAPQIVNHGEKLKDRDVWFYGLENDEAADELCKALQEQVDPEVKCGTNKAENQPIKAWGFYIKD